MFTYQFLLIARIEKFVLDHRVLTLRKLIQELSVDPAELMAKVPREKPAAACSEEECPPTRGEPRGLYEHFSAAAFSQMLGTMAR